MVKEPNNIDFYTTGREPSAQDFERISEWIRKNKQSVSPQKKRSAQQKTHSKQNISNNKAGR